MGSRSAAAGRRGTVRGRAGARAAALALVGAWALAMAGATPAAAQAHGGIRGVVRDDQGRPLAGARLTVLGQPPEDETDDAGAYELARVAAGPVMLLARRIGFAPETLRVDVGAGDPLLLPISLRRVALPLDAVMVYGRRDLRGPMAGFYARMDRGNGRFITFEQIEQKNVRRMSDLLRGIPGLRIEQRRFGVQQYRLRGAQIAPLVWLDGTPMGAGEVDLDNFDPRSFAGIEIYSGPATVPAEFAGGRTMSTSGGTIILWTRQGEFGAPRRKRGTPTPALLVAGMLERREAFTTDAVDMPARLIDPTPAVPIYPDSLFAARVPGKVEVEFVVDAKGRVRMDTFGVVTTTHRALGESVRRAIQSRSYIPAVRDGQAVQQVVQLPFEFLPDSGVVARKPQD